MLSGMRDSTNNLNITDDPTAVTANPAATGSSGDDCNTGSPNKKKSGQEDLTQGSLFKKILIFSLPLVLSNVLQVLFNMADVAVVGRFGRDGSL